MESVKCKYKLFDANFVPMLGIRYVMLNTARIWDLVENIFSFVYNF